MNGQVEEKETHTHAKSKKRVVRWTDVGKALVE